MIDYGKPASNQSQMQIDGFSDRGLELMEEARLWVGRHYEAWMFYRSLARRKCAEGGIASPNYCLQAMRDMKCVSVPNSYAPCFARIAMEQEPGLKFRLAKSKVDGFTKAVL